MSKNTNKSYAVVFTYSFDDESSVYTFATEEQARKFLDDSYAEELRIEKEENGWDSEGEMLSENHYIITSHFGDYDDVTDFYFANIYN